MWLVARLLEEEAQHLAGGIGASRIGVGAPGAPARPRMTAPVNEPLLEDRPPARITLHGAAVGMATGDSTVLHTYRERGGRQLLRASDDGVAIGRVDRGVLIAMENDCRNAAPVTFGTRGVSGWADGDRRWPPHGVER